MIKNLIFFILEILSILALIILTPVYFLIRAVSKKPSAGFLTKAGDYKEAAKCLNNKQGKIIMFHGVSVGEVIALENLIKLARETFKDCRILITTGTKTGQDIAKKKYSEIADCITYFPFDLPICTKSFFKNINPDIILMAETELWPMFAFYAKRKNIPLLLINGRISDDSFKTYKYFGWFFRYIFSCYTGIYTQSEGDKEKIIKMGANSDIAEVMKNLKFDIKKNTEHINFNRGDEKILIAGSTHKGEDEIILGVFSRLKNDFPSLKLMIAPRHLDRVDSIVELIKTSTAQGISTNGANTDSISGFKTGFRSKGADFRENDIIILDTLGELSRMYSIVDIAFIGGSFNNTGGHNPLEATIYSKPVISGPSIKNFKDIYSILTKADAAWVVKTESELENKIRRLLSNEEFYKKTADNSRDIFEDQKGAKDFVIQKIKEIL